MDRYNDEDEDNNNNNNKKVVDVTGNESTSGSKETAALDDGRHRQTKIVQTSRHLIIVKIQWKLMAIVKTLMINQLMSC